MQFRTLLTGALAAAVLTVAALPAHAKCTRLGFSVNDYGKEGPTNDAKKLLDGYIAKWAAEQGIAKYSTGAKSVKCDLFLDFVVFDEHTCRAEADVCWDEKSKGAKPVTAGAAPAEKAAKAEPAAAEKPAKKAVAAPAAPKVEKPAAAAAAPAAPKAVAPAVEAAKPAAAPAARIEAKPATVPAAGITTGTIAKPAAAPAAAVSGPAVVAPGVPPTPAIKKDVDAVAPAAASAKPAQ